MSRMKDLYCISRGEPTLHDVCKLLGLPHDPDRTTEAIVKKHPSRCSACGLPWKRCKGHGRASERKL